MTAPIITIVDTCASTNSELAALTDAPHGTVIATVCQTAGRGQRGNSWEAEPGKNLTFSILLRPATIEAAAQFELSMLVSLAIADAIDSRLAIAGCRERTAIKWPNDIYVGNNKICGILIENSLTGHNIDRCVAGIGINVNQRKFISDAPNPVSLCHFTDTDTELGDFLDEVCSTIVNRIEAYENCHDAEKLKSEYMPRLWRRTGTHIFRSADGREFQASIADVATDGTLTLAEGTTMRRFLFKEVSFVL